eukprot:12936749-Alexandrium_andersonii.AAC.1
MLEGGRVLIPARVNAPPMPQVESKSGFRLRQPGRQRPPNTMAGFKAWCGKPLACAVAMSCLQCQLPVPNTGHLQPDLGSMKLWVGTAA